MRQTECEPPHAPSDLVRVHNGWDTEQRARAATIVQTAIGLGVPPRGWVIAVAVAIQESSLHNLDYGDHAGPDSRGLFQQRHAWGPIRERMNPAASTRLFYTGGHAGQPGLLDIPDWHTMPMTRAANAVQRSRHPDAYAGHEDEAKSLVAMTATPASALSRDTSPCDDGLVDTNSAAGRALTYARDQLGLPYQWGGNGPHLTELPSGKTVRTGGFDCSGLTKAAYAAAGIDLPRTAQTQYNAGPRLDHQMPPQPGDLVFFGTGPAHVTHVGIVVAPGYMIDAPHTGAVVRLERIWTDVVGVTRPAADMPPPIVGSY